MARGKGKGKGEGLNTFIAQQIQPEARPVRPLGTTSTDLVFDANLLEFKKQTKDRLTLSLTLGADEPFSKELREELVAILGENFTELAFKKIEELQMLKILTDAIIN